MAIIQSKEQNGLRIGSLQNVYAESILQENYVSDMIKAYGTDIRYFKLKTPYPDLFKPILDSNNLAMHAYGEGYVQEWEDPINMIAFLKWDSDGIILNAYGIQPDSNLTMWLDQTDFAIALAKKLSQWREYKVTGHSEFILEFNNDRDLIDNRDNISIEFRTDLFDGVLNAQITDRILDQLLAPQPCEQIKSPLPISIPCVLLDHGSLKIDTGRINPLLYKGDHYDPFEDEMVDCHLHLEVFSVQKDRTGMIRIMGGIRGGVIYHDTTVIGKYIDKIRPEVGDLIDVPVPSGDPNKIEVYRQKYEIVQIVETGANESTMNPFLRKYIYEISLRAYISSGSTEPEETQEKKEKQDHLDLISQAAEDAAKKLSLYEDEEHNVYGGYQRVNKRTTSSVQRDASKSTINDFDPPDSKKAKTLPKKKQTIPVFVFKDMGMVLSVVSDPKKNESRLKLSPLKKSTKKPSNHLDYIRADDDTLCLVDDTRAYLLADRFKIPVLDESTYCITPIRLKHEVYAQKGGWADQPFNLVDRDDEHPLDMNIQDLIGKNTTPDDWKNPSENRLCFPYTSTYMEVKYERVPGTEQLTDMEVWTCYVVLAGDETQTHMPICAYFKTPQ